MSAILLAALLVLVPTSTPVPDPLLHFPALANVPSWMNPPRTPTPRPTPRPTATDMRTTLRPVRSGELAAALLVPGALVLPAEGEYTMAGGDSFRMGAGTTIDGKGLVTLHSGLLLQGADGATVRGIRIDRAREDAISVVKTGGWVLIERVDLTGAGDGCLDVVRSSPSGLVVTVRDSVIHDCRKAMLLGHYDPGLDVALVVYLERVTFRDNDARSPKVHRAAVTMRDSRVIRWGSRAVDAQLGARITLSGVRFDEGPDSGPHIRLESGGTFVESGTLFVPFRHRYPAE